VCHLSSAAEAYAEQTQASITMRDSD